MFEIIDRAPEIFVLITFLTVFFLVLAIAAGLEALYRRYRRHRMRQSLRRRIKNIDFAK